MRAVCVRFCGVLAIFALASATADAATVSWTNAGTGPWMTSGNWDTGVPTSDDDAGIDNGGTATIGSGDAAAALNLGLGVTLGNSGNLSISDGSLTLTGGTASTSYFNVGALGTGTFVQSGGLVTANNSWVQVGAGDDTSNAAIGTYNLSGGTLSQLDGYFVVASRGTATANITGGAINLLLSSGTATGGRFLVGYNGGSVTTAGSGTVNQSAGSVVNVGKSMVIGSSFGGAGGSDTYSGGTSNSTYNLTGGALNVGTDGAGGSGLAASSGLTVGRSENATFNQSGGTVTLAGTVGTGTSYNGLYIGGEMGISSWDNHGVGTYNLSGGLLQITGTGTSDRYIEVGWNAPGHFVMTGGTISLINGFDVGGRTSGASGSTFTMNAGSVTIGATSVLTVGWSSGNSARFTMNGGGFQAFNINVGTSNSATGVEMHLNGGTLTTDKMDGKTNIRPGAQSKLYLNGGTIKRLDDNASGTGTGVTTSWVTNFYKGYVSSGGAIFDTGGGTTTTLTIPQLLEEDPLSTGGGLTKNGLVTLVLSAMNTYTGETDVNAGTLSLSQAYLNDASAVKVASGAVLNLTHVLTDTVGAVWFGGVDQGAGTFNAGNSGGYITGTGSLLVVPEPGTLAMLATGLLGLLAYAWRRRK